MTDLLRQSAAWLEQMRTTHCSSPVVYQPVNGDLLPEVSATFGRTNYEITDESGLTIGAQAWDFLVLADDLPIEPRPGDVIVADGRKYEVLPLGADVKGWCWSDPYRRTYRIHTKDIGVST